MGGSRRVGWLAAFAAAWSLGPAPARGLWQSTPIARLTIEGRYDDDLLAEGGGAAAILAPSLGWRLRKPTVDLQASYGIDVFTYARLLPNTGGENQRLRASQTVDFDPRTRFVLRQAAEWLYDPTALARPGVVRTGGEVLFLEADADVVRRMTKRLRAGLGARAERSWFHAAGAEDGTTVAPRALAGLALSPRDDLQGRYRLQIFAFDRAAGWTAHEPAIGYARLLTPSTRLGFELGAAILAGPGGVTHLQPTGRAELSWRLPRFTLTAGGERVLVGAAGLAEPLWASHGTLHGDYRITEPLTASLGLALFRNDRAAGGRVAVGLVAEVGAEYALGEGFAARLVVRRVAQDGEGALGVDLSRNIYAAGLAWRFDGPPPR